MSFQDLLLKYTPNWLGNFLIRFRWGRSLFGFSEPEPIRWIDDTGGGWRRPPNWLNADYEDVGQHDVWKREMRVFLLRVIREMPKDAGVIDLQDFGMSHDSRPVRVPTLWPVGSGLADACRRLGFLRLARAAMGGPGRDPISLETLHRIWTTHQAAVKAEAERRKEYIEGLAKKGAVPSSTSPERAAEEAEIDLDLGPFDPQIGSSFPLAHFFLPPPTHSVSSPNDYTRTIR